ncbi:unnamed protein product [Notodromas monacha]|uniref:Uncharacterized protein n=1 Tax=Notodromas monacha TaxID=399045 RepID=A0A7R9C2J7_9CRUS|nr:unnamed protein product [Notodromas monacha]CAD7284451.1 unnamed protein product [Notodromas monacha]CAG0913841.1 unnamed protein product [Notodromas monacha]CAG0924603.1 unnamed protein product [Notodromas monacha]
MCDNSDSPGREVLRKELAKLEEEIYQLKKQRKEKRDEIYNMKRDLGVSLLSEFYCEVKTGLSGLRKDLDQDISRAARDLKQGFAGLMVQLKDKCSSQGQARET